MDTASAVPELTEEEMLPCTTINELLSLLKYYFDQTWFLLLVEDLPGNGAYVREISTLLEYKELLVSDKKKLLELSSLLDCILQNIRYFLIPKLREKLGISRFTSERFAHSDHQVRNKFIASVFPDNLERITDISCRLKDCLSPYARA